MDMFTSRNRQLIVDDNDIQRPCGLQHRTVNETSYGGQEERTKHHSVTCDIHLFFEPSIRYPSNGRSQCAEALQRQRGCIVILSLETIHSGHSSRLDI